ncbi:tRNA (Uracil-5-)-methyltransferase-like A [Lamellibrachia satsuma]|nr:tRNA (Uracil-5-)-methyltransferase-like A [Lamellibrachia satsuma]
MSVRFRCCLLRFVDHYILTSCFVYSNLMEVDAEKVSGGSHIDSCPEHQQFGMEACPKDREDAPVPDDKKPEDTESSAFGMNAIEVDATCGSKVVHESSNGAKVSQDEADRTEVSQDTANESKVSQDDTDRTKDDTAGSDGAACCDKEEVVDPYSYLERDGFTSEIFKIEVCNLPKRFGISQLKKKFTAIGVKRWVKMKLPERGQYIFLTFRCEEDRESAIELIDGHQWKGQELKAKKANPAADPLLKKRKQESEQRMQPNKKAKLSKTESDVPVEIRLNESVTPLWKMPYEEQLKSKENEICVFLKKLGKSMEKENVNLHPWISQQRKENNGLCCRLHDMKPSPVLDGYRNKCEFTVGRSGGGEDKVVGFRVGSYRSGDITVAEPTHCVNVPAAAKHICKEVQHYLQTFSDKAAFDPLTKTGHWRTVIVRVNQLDEALVIIQLCGQDLSQEEICLEREKLKEYFETGEGKNKILKSLYLEVYRETPGRSQQNAGELELLFGQPYICEDLLDMKFRVSPTAFFQVNTAGAAVLYTVIADWCKVQPTTTLLDICCGTGTIGLSMAKRLEKVIGVELCKEAVEDAQFNAQENGIVNAEFQCGKAEDVLPSVMHRLNNTDVVAVVDPPRSGLHPDVVRAIRRSCFVKRLVYVSCNPKATLPNIIDFTRSESRRVKGAAFKLIEAVPVDMFPHTSHCELVMLLMRD